MKTRERSPRAVSEFKTSETRETYRMKEEILDIIKRENGRAVSVRRIVNKGNALHYCRPLDDSERIAVAHPYWKVLSEMTEPTSPLFVNNLEEIKTDSVLRYRIRTDAKRTSNGTWKKVRGAKLLYAFPSK